MRQILAALVACCLASAASAQIPPSGLGAASTISLKASGGSLLDASVTTSSAGYLFVFNSKTAPASGSVIAGTASGDYQDCIDITAAGTYQLSSYGLPGEAFSAGIYLAWSSTGCGTLTLASPLFMKGRVQ